MTVRTTDMSIAKDHVDACKLALSEARARHHETHDAWQAAMLAAGRAVDSAWSGLSAAQRRVKEIEDKDVADRAAAIVEIAQRFTSGLVNADVMLAAVQAASVTA